jgi:MFS family permease
LQLSSEDSFIVTLCIGSSNFAWLFIFGGISDRIGRRLPLLLAALAAFFIAYPLLAWLVAAPSFGGLLGAGLLLSFLFGCYNGAMIPYLTQIIPAEIRVGGFSLSFSTATALFGGFTPAISTGLIHMTGDKAMPGAWLSAAGLLGVIGWWWVGRLENTSGG